MCTPPSLCRLCLGEILVFTKLFQPIPGLCLAGEHTSLWARSPEAGSTERRKIRNKKIQGTDALQIQGGGVWRCFLFFSRWSPITILAGDFLLWTFWEGRCGAAGHDTELKEAGHQGATQSLDASSRSSLEDETRGPGLPGVTPTGSQNPCTHRVSEF